MVAWFEIIEFVYKKTGMDTHLFLKVDWLSLYCSTTNNKSVQDMMCNK